MALGSPPERYQVAFATDRMTQLLEYEPADLTCRVQAGMGVADLQRHLQAQGQRLPLDPPHPNKATVGGMVASNASGLSRNRYGTVRDWVIGIAVAYPSGKVARAGGKVVKNVAGYDLMKLHIGALGTLGVVAEVNLKVLAVPEASDSMLAHFDAAGPAVQAAQRLSRVYLAPAAAIVLNRAAMQSCGVAGDWTWALALKLEGYRKEVAAARDLAARAIADAGGSVGQQIIANDFWERARDWSAPEDERVVLRAITSMAQLPALASVLPADGELMLQPAAGSAEVRVASHAASAPLVQLRSALGEEGQVIVASAPAAIKNALDIWGPPPPGFPLMRALKEALDPHRILNPGRFVGGI